MSKPVKIDENFRELAPDEVLDGLRHVDFRDASRLVRRANAMAQDYVGDGRDLLHDAVTRAVTSRTCRCVDAMLRITPLRNDSSEISLRQVRDVTARVTAS